MELIFTSFTNIAGCSFLIWFTGYCTEALVTMSSKNSVPRSKVKCVIRYLIRRNVDRALCMRVKRYLQYVVSELPERQIDPSILDQVSMSLRAELLCVTIGTQLKVFPLFQRIEQRALEKLSLLSEVDVYTSEDIIESHGQLASGLFVIVQGSVQVSNAKIQHTREIRQNEYFGQTSLFRDEVRVGTVVALEVTEIVHLGKESLERLADVYPGLKVEMGIISAKLANGDFRTLWTTKESWEKEYMIASEDDLMHSSHAVEEDSGFGVQMHSGRNSLARTPSSLAQSQR